MQPGTRYEVSGALFIEDLKFAKLRIREHGRAFCHACCHLTMRDTHRRQIAMQSQEEGNVEEIDHLKTSRLSMNLLTKS